MKFSFPHVESLVYFSNIAHQQAVKSYISQMQQADTQKVDSLLTILKKKDYLPGRLPSVSKENPGFSNAPLPSEVISIKEYMNGMSTFIQYLTK